MIHREGDGVLKKMTIDKLILIDRVIKVDRHRSIQIC